MTHLVPGDHPVLRGIASPVPVEAIGSKKIKDIIQKMAAVLETQDDGVAIAAPQIGVPLRIFIVSGKALDLQNKKKSEEEMKLNPSPDLVCINPVITKLSRTKRWMAEGCLSVRYLYGKIERSTHATITAYNEHGIQFTRGGSGLLAQIFQHETDHLDGKLFIDRAKDIENLPPQDGKVQR